MTIITFRYFSIVVLTEMAFILPQELTFISAFTPLIISPLSRADPPWFHKHFPIDISTPLGRDLRCRFVRCNASKCTTFRRWCQAASRNLDKQKGWKGEMGKGAVSHTWRLSDLSTWFFGDAYEYFRRKHVYLFKILLRTVFVRTRDVEAVDFSAASASAATKL